MKKILITGAITCCIIAGLIFLYHSWYIDYNLRKYSVYYANNMEHKEGTHPELAMAMENMGTIYRPNKKNIRYRDKAGYTVYNKSTNSESVILQCSLKEKKYRYIYSDTMDRDYHFNEVFNLTLAYDGSTGLEEIDINTIDQEALYKDIYKNFGFLVKDNVNRKPPINMQKRFNEKYYKRFN